MVSVLPAINKMRALSPALVCSYLILHHHLCVQQEHFFGQESRPHCDKCCIDVVRRNKISQVLGFNGSIYFFLISGYLKRYLNMYLKAKLQA